MSEVTKQIVLDALNQVEDPELMMGIVDIGLVYEVEIDEVDIDEFDDDVDDHVDQATQRQ